MTIALFFALFSCESDEFILRLEDAIAKRPVTGYAEGVPGKYDSQKEVPGGYHLAHVGIEFIIQGSTFQALYYLLVPILRTSKIYGVIEITSSRRQLLQLFECTFSDYLSRRARPLLFLRSPFATLWALRRAPLSEV